MGAFISRFFGFGDKREPIKGIGPRIQNIAKNNFRGILGATAPLIFLTWRVNTSPERTVECMWLTMLWMFFIQPIPVPCTALIPVAFLPMVGAMNSAAVCDCYFNEGVALFLLSSMLILLPNNSGFDRRFILKILCSGKKLESYTSKKLLIKCSFAAYIASMFSNRLIVTSVLTQYISPIITSLGSGGETSYDNIRNVINIGIQTSAAVGSIGIMHSAYCTHAFRTIFIESCVEAEMEYPDVFNYLQYSLFALPLSLLMFICNLIYHLYLLEFVRGKEMGDASRISVKNQLQKHKESIPAKVTNHEKISIFFLILALILLCVRHNRFVAGWALYNADEGKPLIHDVTLVAAFVVLMHCLPRSLNFLNIFIEDKKSKLNLKPESSILFWRFVNLNVNYGYFIVIGSGVAIGQAVKLSGLYKHIVEYAGAPITGLDIMTGLFLICLVCTFMANGMTGVTMVVIALPFVLNMARDPAPEAWQHNVYRAALGVGIAGSLGFMWPFLHTPAYICHTVGKVPMIKMAKYSIFSAFMCCVLLWVALVFYAPVIFDPEGSGIVCDKAAFRPTEPPPD